jgi:N-acetylmuramoyl-L-alanine amidase
MRPERLPIIGFSVRVLAVNRQFVSVVHAVRGLCLCVAGLGLCFFLSAQAASVVVDTGHTPLHPGAHGPDGLPEYQFNLRLSGAVSEHLRSAGIQVTRVSADGQEIELAQRSQVNPKADLFVSIHHDSIQQAWIDAGRRSEFKGYALFVSEKNPQYAQSLDCAEHLGRQLQSAGEAPSLYHATPIPGENRPLINPDLGIHRFDDLVVLKTAAMPAVLIEAGVIANPSEEARLGQPDTVDHLATAISQGIEQCLRVVAPHPDPRRNP